MFLTVTVRDEDGKSLGVLVLKEKTFSTGNAGYFGTGKVEIGGQRYQAQCQLVAVGDKGKRENGRPAGE